MNQENIRLVEGDAVLQLLEDPVFFERLSNLYEESTETTIFQSPGFIRSWYLIKISEFVPLIAIDQSNSSLEAAVFLAIKRESSGQIKKSHAKIVGLGEYDAEYQTWLVREGKEESFLSKAFDLILQNHPKCKLVFRFIPSAKSLTWLDENPKWNKLSVVQPYRRPLMQMSHPDFRSVFKKRHLKAKYNRFVKAGKMEFEEITEINRFIEVYDEVMILYDFRQGALFNKTPSTSNPLRRPLFISLFEQNILQVSVLKLDDVITSCIIGMKSKIWVHLSGLVTYSPFYSKHSPGLVHLFVLGKYLEKQGFEYFDLTPGDDGYKERMASNADEVYELTICKDPVFKSKRKLRKKLHAFLLSKGIRPMTFNVKVQLSKHLIKLKLNHLKNRIFLSMGHQSGSTSESIQLEKNNIQHLLAYDDHLGTSRWDFLSDAFKRVEAGEICLSWAEERRLLVSIWFQEINDKTNKNEDEPAFIHKGTYIHPKALSRKEEIMEIASSILPSLGP
ncbi:MAG: GNAT family N-acetyltransferase [Cyclobacteriaceae bacterium]